MRAHSKHVVAALLIVIAVFALYRKATRLWWTYDDAYLLHVAIANDAPGYLLDNDYWRNAPGRMFVPPLVGTYEALFAAFELDARWWYVAQLALLAAAAVALFAALRMYLSTVAACAGALLFVAGPPLCSVATQLMVIHYPQAILLGALSAIAFVRALRRDRYGWSIVSAALCFAAILAKEIAVPLPFALLLLPDRDLRTRVRFAVPHFAALIAYFAWRWWAIGTPLGGYGWAVSIADLPALLASLPWKIVQAWAGARLEVGLVLIGLVVLIAVERRRPAGWPGGVPPPFGAQAWTPAGQPARTPAFLAALILAVGPIVPVSKEMQDRYAVVPWLVVAVAFAAGAERLRRRDVVLAVTAVLALIANRQEWRAEYAKSIRMSDEARVFVELPADALLRTPIVPPAAMGELNWLRTGHLGRPPGASWFYDELMLCAQPELVGTKRVFQYDAARREVVEVTSSIASVAEKHCGGIRSSAPLSTEFHFKDGVLRWTFGPYRDGRYRVIIANGIQAFDVPREDAFRLPDLPGLTLRVRYDSPQGWVTYSPDIALDFVHHPDYEWHR